jgi:hypothetical protein
MEGNFFKKIEVKRSLYSKKFRRLKIYPEREHEIAAFVGVHLQSFL